MGEEGNVGCQVQSVYEGGVYVVKGFNCCVGCVVHGSDAGFEDGKYVRFVLSNEFVC